MHQPPIFESISSRLERWAQLFWRWIGATPVALKVIGLVVLPLFVVSIGGALFIREELLFLLQTHGAQSIQAEIFLGLTRQIAMVLAVVAFWV